MTSSEENFEVQKYQTDRSMERKRQGTEDAK